MELKEAISPEHDKIEETLKEFAIGKGYDRKWSGKMPSGANPDVKRERKRDAGKRPYLFLGDAKVSKNETSTTTATIDRVTNYIKDVAKLLLSVFGRARVAIATDDKKEAIRWKIWLEKTIEEQRLESTQGFEILDRGDGVWIAHGLVKLSR